MYEFLLREKRCKGSSISSKKLFEYRAEAEHVYVDSWTKQILGDRKKRRDSKEIDIRNFF